MSAAVGRAVLPWAASSLTMVGMVAWAVAAIFCHRPAAWNRTARQAHSSAAQRSSPAMAAPGVGDAISCSSPRSAAQASRVEDTQPAAAMPTKEAASYAGASRVGFTR